MRRTLTISREQLGEMITHADVNAPLEACGLLAGSEALVTRVIKVRNQAQSPVRFVMDPIEQLHAFEWIESNGLELLGIFHSHPSGPETVSPTDIAEASYPVVQVILSCSPNGWKARGFWIHEDTSHEVALHFE